MLIEMQAPQQPVIQQQPAQAIPQEMLQSPTSQAIGIFGDDMIKGVGQIIGAFMKDPLGSILKIGLLITEAVAGQSMVLPGAAGIGLNMFGGRFMGGYGGFNQGGETEQ